VSKLCIYHGGCDDGFGAAYAVWKKFGDEFEYHPGIYGKEPPDTTGKEVVMVDFSYKLEVIESIIEKCDTLLILDHHKTAEADLRELIATGRIQGEFDMDRSGAMMAWQYFHPDTKPPKLIEHIQDRDLWQFKIPCTKTISMALRSYDQEFSVWDELMNKSAELAGEGVAIERYHRKQIEFTKSCAWMGVIDGHEVPIVNCPPSMASEVAGELSEGHPFAAVFWQSDSSRTYSLRSRDKGLDVSEIAKRHGGGGHRNAAGFKVDI